MPIPEERLRNREATSFYESYEIIYLESSKRNFSRVELVFMLQQRQPLPSALPN
jgi:hypothetical protein